MMDKERFAAIVAAYGAAPHRWPQDERAAAERYAAAHRDECAPLLAEARTLDAALADAPAPAPSDLLAARVMAAHRAASRQGWLNDPRRAALALAACAVFGVIVGFGGGRLTPATPQPDNAEAMIAAVFGGAEDAFALFGDGG
ncbi:MAG: hypothetical protein GC206_11475 [Alphaproteobacteria bacterium]|nr:hypothetical protein [Alphaproteobacteria bacterium]